MQTKKIKILFLYAEVMGYLESVIDELASNYTTEIIIIENTEFKLTSYSIKNETGLVSYFIKKRIENLHQFCNDFNPDITYVSGRMDSQYLKIAHGLKKSGKIVVTGIDNQWTGTIRQTIGSLFSYIFYQKYFTNAWVAGSRQYNYALRMGFNSQQIISNLYSGDFASFSEVVVNNATSSKTILFVGRITKIKGINLLIEGFKEIKKDEVFDEWTLLLVGGLDGTISIPNRKDIMCFPFADKLQLIEIAKNASFFCLPSFDEPWGLVIHEFAAAGLPLLISDKCGAGDMFLINGWNGYNFKSGSLDDFTIKLKKMMTSSQNDRNEMGLRSKILSSRITPLISAASLMSLIK